MNIGRAVGTFAGSVTLAYRAVGRTRLRSHAFGQLVLRLSADQKRIWCCLPRAWKPALGVVGITAALIALDPLDTPWLQQPAYRHKPVIRLLNRILSGGNMAILIQTPPLFFFVGGLLFRDSYAWQTGLYAAEAAANAEIIAITMKHIDRRMRPIELGPDGDFTRTWFRTKNRALDGSGCFPSGHTAAAFAVATVLAARYPAWRGIVYGLAGMIGLSRINARAHFPSDVFFGAAAGYSISRFIVLERAPLAKEPSA